MPVTILDRLPGDRQTGTAEDLGSLTLIYKVTPAKIGALTLDASIQETHQADVEATEFPVESGANITDHAREKPETVSIEGVISNTPIPKEEREKVGEQKKGAPGRAAAAYEQLRAMKAERKLITLVTALRTYQDMLLVSLSVPRDARQGDILRFNAQFRQIVVVQSDTVRFENTHVPTKPTGKDKKGKTLTKPVETGRTAAKTATDWFGWTKPGSGVPG